jgi:TolB-like protein
MQPITNQNTLLNVAMTALILTGLGCASSLQPTEFTNPDVDFGFIERVAVLPFENLSSDQQAGFRATRLMITELLASGAVDVVEPGEVEGALAKIRGRPSQPSIEEIVGLGQSLQVQAVILGTVAQSEILRSGAVAIPAVTLDAQMVETETGAIIWAATHTEKGGSASARFLGSGGQPISATTRKCVQELLASLLQ